MALLDLAATFYFKNYNVLQFFDISYEEEILDNR